MDTEHTISSYLIDKLYANGVRHIFGVAGDYVLGFYKALENSPIKIINTCDEQGAGFAADAYARINGLGAVCITYCVGGLKVANSTAQAFAEKSPVIVISGAPGINERTKNALLHHKVRDFDTQLKVFEQLTVATTLLDDAETACQEIDRVFNAAARHKRPVYIELPRDKVLEPINTKHEPIKPTYTSDANALSEALKESTKMIKRAKQPVILAGVELHRFGLQDVLHTLLDSSNIPVASTILSKSVIAENHPLYLGVYEGAMCRDEVREYVESSDCIMMLGVFLTDVNLGIFTSQLDEGKSIYVTSEKVTIKYHSFEHVEMADYLQGLSEARFNKQITKQRPHPPAAITPTPTAGKKMTVSYLFQRLNTFLDDNTVVIADPGDAMFAAIDMIIHGETEFLAPAYYTSLGFAVPASMGAQLANPALRALVLVGDGAFQMTGMELSSIARFKLNPIIIVLNNRGYGTERPMLDGQFNDIHPWQFSKIPLVLNAGKGFYIKSENQLEEALVQTEKHNDEFCILDVQLDPDDSSLSLQRLTAALSKRVQ
ncbi:MAG: preprotein translocase subunit Tim44 [Cycloclasticus sp. symbiont of Poecilosclerida sp. M]|nr:MAG: preprotein translocase subunit Tim44 [Cycloclasticus sp. symbiont of Poecilosclerida sp. M]